MPVLYKPFQSILEDKNKKKLFHPRVIYTANVSTTQLAKEIAAYSSLSTGDVKNTLDNLVTVAAQLFRNNLTHFSSNFFLRQLLSHTQ